MARPVSVGRPKRPRKRSAATREAILDAAKDQLLDAGYARMSTRGVAEKARVPLSQLHYHFGSKRQLVLDLLQLENERRLARQAAMYGEEKPLWQRYEQACDFLEDDLASGYVRVLQEMIAAGWSDEEIGGRVRAMLKGWVDLLTDVATETERRYGPLGPFPPEEVAALVGQAFMGAESMLLLGFGRDEWAVRSSLRRFALVIRQLEEGGDDARAGA